VISADTSYAKNVEWPLQQLSEDSSRLNSNSSEEWVSYYHYLSKLCRNNAGNNAENYAENSAQNMR